MTYLRKYWGRTLIALPFLAWLYTRLFWPSTILDAPEILSNLYAKEFCSCVFVVGQSEEICRENTRQKIPASDIRVDREKNEVNTRVWWSLSQAKYLGEGQGCRLSRL